MHHPDPEKHRLLFRIGLVTVVVSFPFGYGGILLFAILAAARKNHVWLWGGMACYAFSWVMLGVGFWLGGRPAYDYARRFWHLRERRRRLFHLRRTRAERQGQGKVDS